MYRKGWGLKDMWGSSIEEYGSGSRSSDEISMKKKLGSKLKAQSMHLRLQRSKVKNWRCADS